MKKLAIIMTFTLILTTGVTALAERDDDEAIETLLKHGIIMEHSFKGYSYFPEWISMVLQNNADAVYEFDPYVKRFECIMAIMRAIGVTDEVSKSRMGTITETQSTVYEMYGQDCFLDEDPIVRLKYQYLGYTEFNSDIIFWYPETARVNKIAFGQEVDGSMRFLPGGNVTTKEVLAFMVRCLKNPDDLDAKDIDATFARAEEIGLISNLDEFYNNPEECITPEDFCVLLYRFSQQPRYKYFRGDKRSDEYKADECEFDEEGRITYLEYLQNR